MGSNREQYMITKEYLDQTYLRNMGALEKYFPELFEIFSDYKESRYFLIYDNEGGYNIYDDKKSCNVYPCSPLEFCADSFSKYRESPIFFSKLQGSASELASLVNPVHTKYVKSLAGLSYAHDVLNPLNEKFPDKIKSMLFIGVGIGHDVQHILENKSISNVYILEKEPDIFYASLFILDWESILEKLNKEGKSCVIYVDSNVDLLVSKYYESVVKFGHHNVNSMFLYCPLELDGYSDLYTEISNIVRGRLLAGFGFYDDSRLSIAATIANVNNEIPLYVKSNKIKDIIVSDDIPVFVVGAGPSLDEDMEFIKDNQNKAIIISCGSGIKPLERHGVVPDFHFECERTAFTKHWLDQVNVDFIKKVNFVGLNLIYPDVYTLFNRVGMLAKSSETGSFMLGKTIEKYYGVASLPLHTHVNPTVVHMGVGVAPFLGLKKLYLFGVDMGYKDPNNHHSKASSYADLKTSKKDMFMPSNSIRVDSNFDESEIYTDDGYVSFRVFLEGIIDINKKIFKDFECFNCSDGAKIKGAVPKKERDFLLDRNVIDKSFISNDIMDVYFDKDCCANIKDDFNDLVRSDVEIVVNACDVMSNYFVFEADSIDDADARLSLAVNKLFHSDELFSDDKAYLLSLFSGSMLYMFSTMVRILYSRTGRPNENIKAANTGFKIISEFFKEVKIDISKNYSKNDDMSLYDLF